MFRLQNLEWSCWALDEITYVVLIKLKYCHDPCPDRDCKSVESFYMETNLNISSICLYVLLGNKIQITQLRFIFLCHKEVHTKDVID